jgi:hypothetical protein
MALMPTESRKITSRAVIFVIRRPRRILYAYLCHLNSMCCYRGRCYIFLEGGSKIIFPIIKQKQLNILLKIPNQWLNNSSAEILRSE